MRVLAILVLLAGSAAAQPASEFRRAQSRHRLAQDEFWRAYQGRMNEAQEISIRPVRDAYSRASEDREAVQDMSPYRRLYEEHAAIEAEFGRAARVLAEADDPEAPRLLLRELFDALEEIDRADEALRNASATSLVDRFDQRPGITRYGLAERESGLVGALALHPAFLATEGWPEAVRKDGKRSHAHRVAVLDALGAAARPAARPVLESALASEEVPIRIAAIEGLALHGPAATPALLALARDPSDVVRRALLDVIRSHPEPRWIRPLLDVYPASVGALRQSILDALAALTGERFGDEPARWAAWSDAHREEIDAGTFAPGPAAAEMTTSSKGPTFYGLPLRGRGTIFLLDWSSPMRHPADWEFERTRYQDEWLYGDQSWKGEHVTHHDFLVAELDRALEALPPEARFAILLGTDGFRSGVEEMEEYVLPPKGLLAPTRPALGRAARFVRERKPYHWRSQLSMLATAWAIADRDPAADTVILLGDGAIHGGLYIVPEPALAAFARANRFRRLVVHTIRLRDAKEDAATLMSGIARLSGGHHVWLRNPPAGR